MASVRLVLVVVSAMLSSPWFWGRGGGREEALPPACLEAAELAMSAILL